MEKQLSRILLVEDDEDIRAITCFSLETLAGYEVKEFENGYEAINAIPYFNPDLILCDVMMPVMSGVQVLKKLKSTTNFKDIPFVFMSARVQKHECDYYKSIGAIDIINKPFDPALLLEKLAHIWSNR